MKKLLVLAVALLAGCGGGGTEPTVPAKMAGSGDGQTALRSAAVATAPGVTLTDTHGHAASGVVVNFAASGDSKVVPATVTTDANGVAKVTSWTLGTTAGGYTLTATASGYPTVTINATASPPKATTLSIVAGNNQTGNGLVAFATAPKVKVVDELGLPMSGVSVTFLPLPPTMGDSAIGATQTTGSDGTATLTRWVPSAIGGARTLTATVSGLPEVTFSAIGTAVPVTRSTGAICVDTIGQVINGKASTVAKGICGLVTLTTTTTVTNGVGSTSLTAFVRGMQGSLGWNDASTSAAVTIVDLNLASGSFGNTSMVANVTGTVSSVGAGKATDVWHATQSSKTLTFTAIPAGSGQAIGGAGGCNLDPTFGAPGQMKAPYYVTGSCDPGNTGGWSFGSTIAGIFTANDFGIRLGFTSGAGFFSCYEAGSPGTSSPTCITGPKKP